MILSAHYFRSHISWSSTCVVTIIWSPFSWDTKICYSYVAIAIHQQVLRFDISVYYTIVVHILKSNNATCDEKLCLFFCKLFLFVVMVSEITTGYYVCDEEEILVILKSIKHVYQEWMLQLTQKFSLVHNTINTFFLYNSTFRHFFHSIIGFKFLSFNSPYFTKSTFSDNVMKLEMWFVNTWTFFNRIKL